MKTQSINLDEIGKVTLRPAQSDDALRIADMHERLSLDSLYYRYFRPYRPPLAEFERICRLTPDQGAIFVATLDDHPTTSGQLVGLAYYLVSQSIPGEGEPAFLIEDRFQGQGLGRRLFAELSRHALRQGILRWQLHVEVSNNRMMQIVRKSGYLYHAHCSYGTCEIDLRLDTRRTNALPSLSGAALN